MEEERIKKKEEQALDALLIVEDYLAESEDPGGNI